MDTLWNLRWLFYVGVSFALQKTNAVTFTNEETSFLQMKKWNLSETRTLGFRFKTFLSDALLLYIDDGGNTNFLRVELFQGKLRLTCSLGAKFGAMTVEIGENLNDLVWHRVFLERYKGKMTITLDSPSKSRTVKGRAKIESSMYFGGLPPKLSANSVTQPSVTRLNRFVGCMTDIEMFEHSPGQGKRTKPIEEDSNETVPGCTDMCDQDHTCQNNGTCLNKFTTTACDCTATGFRGKTCNEALPVLGLGQSDYVIFNRTNQAISTQQDRIIFRFKTTNQNGSLLESGRGRDYLVIELINGSILLRWNLGSGEMYLHMLEKLCNDDKWHSVRIARNRLRLNVTLDGSLHISRLFPGSYVSFDLKQGEGNVYIGGMLTYGFPSKSRSSGTSFDGCLQEINFNGVDIVQGVVNGEDLFTTQGHPRSTCARSKDLDPTTRIVTNQATTTTTTTTTTTEQSTTSSTPTSYTPMTTMKHHTHGSQRVPTSHTEIFSGNSVTPCSDDEENCDSDYSASGDGKDSWGANRQSSGDRSSSSSGDHTEKQSVTSPNIGTNKSSRKPIKGIPGKNSSSESEGIIVGEPDIDRTNCIQDDEDGCDKDDESGQSSTEIGSAGSASPTITLPPVVSSTSSHTKIIAYVRMKKNSSEKWGLIAGIIVVGTLLVAFCIFAIWWLCKNKNDPNWTGTHQGSTEKCLQAEVTEV